MTNAVSLAQALIRRPSVTPDDAGALGLLEEALKPLGFACHRLRFEEADTPPVENLYARAGDAGPVLAFAGHTDVVPPGDRALWRSDPFAADIRDGVLYGRGAADMKTAIACFVAAAARYRKEGKGSLALLITGDEEGPAINGTRKILAWMKAHGERIDHCIVGEPTAAAHAGDTIKIGRRGSMNVRLTVTGVQGHAAYPAQAVNPIPALAVLVNALAAHRLDDGTEHFEPSTLAFTSVDVGNEATNVIPAEARAAFNIRFNDRHTPEALLRWIERVAEETASAFGCEVQVRAGVSGTAFLTAPGPFTEMIADAVLRVTGARPDFSTGGGTSDARFIKDHCPVAELGLPNATMHKADECVALAEIERLTDIYAALMESYFTNPPR